MKFKELKKKMLFGIPYTKYNIDFLDKVQKAFDNDEIGFETKEVEIDEQETHLQYYVYEHDYKNAKAIVKKLYEERES